MQEKYSAVQEKDSTVQEKYSAVQEKYSAVQEKYSAVQEKFSALQRSDFSSKTSIGIDFLWKNGVPIYVVVILMHNEKDLNSKKLTLTSWSELWQAKKLF